MTDAVFRLSWTAIRSALLLAVASASVWAQQLYFFEEMAWQRMTQPPGKAVIADITATLTAPTPWGSFTQTETGKYWRSRKGQVRQDTSHGQSSVLDFSSSRSLTWIDYEIQRIWSQQRILPRPRISSAPAQGYAHQPSDDATGKDFRFQFGDGSSTKPEKSGQNVLDGFKVTIRKGQTNGGSYEIWTADALQIILLFKLKSGNTEFVQRYRNIRLEEPDPSIFQLPLGFRMFTLNERGECQVGVSGQQRPTEVIRSCLPTP
jgi:hypothetical protein